MAKLTNANALDLMEEFLAEVRTDKKANFDPSEPTTHPVMDADDGTQPGKEGERSSENESDVRKDYGEGGNTGQEDANAADGTNAADSIGTQSQESDEVKGNVQQPKATKEDPEENGRGDGSPGHPTNQTFNEKYSSVINLGTEILKDFSRTPEPKEASAEGGDEGEESELTDEEKRAAADKYPEDAEAGYMAAAAIAQNLGFDKTAQAQEQLINASVENIIKSAQADATNLFEFLQGINQGGDMALNFRLNKSAEPTEGMEEEEPAEHEAAESPEEEMAEEEAEAAGLPEADEGGEEIPPEMLAALGGGGGEEEMPGDEDQAIEAVAETLDAAGITPEALIQAIQQGGAPEGAGVPAEAMV